ncbi:MAG: rhodanese-like domain-containing protein [Clostridium sp.]
MRIKLKTKSTIFLIAILLLLGVFSGCSNKSNNEATTEPLKASIVNITPEEAKNRLDGENEIILLDVRTKEEYETGHIEKAILMPLDTLASEVQKSLKDKEATIFVYCRSGSRSSAAADILIEKGYKKVYNLGGIIDWPYEIEM